MSQTYHKVGPESVDYIQQEEPPATTGSLWVKPKTIYDYSNITVPNDSSPDPAIVDSFSSPPEQLAVGPHGVYIAENESVYQYDHSGTLQNIYPGLRGSAHSMAASENIVGIVTNQGSGVILDANTLEQNCYVELASDFNYEQQTYAFDDYYIVSSGRNLDNPNPTYRLHKSGERETISHPVYYDDYDITVDEQSGTFLHRSGDENENLEATTKHFDISADINSTAIQVPDQIFSLRDGRSVNDERDLVAISANRIYYMTGNTSVASFDLSSSQPFDEQFQIELSNSTNISQETRVRSYRGIAICYSREGWAMVDSNGTLRYHDDQSKGTITSFNGLEYNGGPKFGGRNGNLYLINNNGSRLYKYDFGSPQQYQVGDVYVASANGWVSMGERTW